MSTFIFLSGCLVGVLGCLSIVRLPDDNPPATARALRRQRKALRAVLPGDRNYHHRRD